MSCFFNLFLLAQLPVLVPIVESFVPLYAVKPELGFMSQCRSVQGLCRGWKPSKYVSLVVGSFPIDGEVKRAHLFPIAFM